MSTPSLELARLIDDIDKAAAGMTLHVASVLRILGAHADNAHRCYPSVARIAKKAPMSERQVYRAIAWLEDNGYVTIRHGRQHAPNIYTLQAAKLASLPSVPPSTKSGCQEGTSRGPTGRLGEPRANPRNALQPRDPDVRPDPQSPLASPDGIPAGRSQDVRVNRPDSQSIQTCPPVSPDLTGSHPNSHGLPKNSQGEVTPHCNALHEARKKPEIAWASVGPRTDPYADAAGYIRTHLRTKTTSERDFLDALMRSGQPCSTYAKLGLHTQEQIDAAWTAASNEQKGNAA